MLESSQPSQSNYEPVNGLDPNDRRLAAKWPPDDADLPDDPAPKGENPPVPPDGSDFKHGSHGKKIAIFAVLLVLIAGVLAVIATKHESTQMTIDQISAEQKRIYMLPGAQARLEWRKWAANPDVFELQQEALLQLAWLNDSESIPLQAKALEQEDHRIRGVAAQALAKFGSPAADTAKPALEAAFAKSDSSDEPQLAWALVVLHDATPFDHIMRVYRAGHLSKVQRVGGGPSFDPELFAKLQTPEQWAGLVEDKSESVRQLVSTILSKNAEPKFTDTLIKLVQDPDIDVAREAAPGLGKIGDDKARTPLLAALSKADPDSRKKFLEALRDGIGGQGLVMGLAAVDKSTPERAWNQTKLIFEMLKELSDPRGSDLLVKYIETKPARHWITEAAMRLAEVGDVRAVPYLAERLAFDSKKLYQGSELLEEKALSRDDNERVIGTRMMADLAVLNPEKRDQIRAQAEQPVTDWITGMPSPHANGLRFLAAADSRKSLPKLREWAFPTGKLPREGQQPPMPAEWVIAQSALRYVGWMKDTDSWPKFEKQLERRKSEANDVDTTMESLMGGGLAIVGMAVRALGVGVSDGYAQWGDPKAYPILIKFIENKLENEQARFEACFALGWVTPEDKVREVADKIVKYAKSPEEKDQIIASCYAESLARHPFPAANADMIALLSTDKAPILRLKLAQAIGVSELTDKDISLLMEKLKDSELRGDAALALILGSDADTASRVVAMFGDFPAEALSAMQDAYFNAFGYWSDQDLEKGRLYRWVRNAEAIRRVRVRGNPQEWASFLLSKQFDNLMFDNGPHSMTRVVLRNKLRQIALTGDAATRDNAIRTLRFMKEQGQLMALKEVKGDVGAEAGRALFELMNPKAVLDVKVPELKGKPSNNDEPSMPLAH